MLPINIQAILVSNALAACLCLTILFSKNRHIRMVAFDDYAFYSMCVITIVQCVLESSGFLMDGHVFPGSYFLFRFINVLVFLLTVIMALIWVLYIDFKLFEDISRIRKRIYKLGFPILVICLMCIANLFVPIFFDTTPNNVYVRKPLLFLVFLINYIYMVYGIVLVLYYRKKLNRYIFLPTILFLAPIFISTILQGIFYGISLMWTGTALGLNALYICLQNEESYIDPLTGLYNRTYLFSYLFNIGNKQSNIVGMMLDLNAFKQINDTYGHLEGDQALRAVGKILLDSVGHICLITRYGGDEFVLIVQKPQETKIEQVRERILARVESYNQSSGKPYQISFSMGACNYTGKSLDDFFKQMDMAMYEEKKEFYAMKKI